MLGGPGWLSVPKQKNTLTEKDYDDIRKENELQDALKNLKEKNTPGNNKRTARQRVFPHPKVMGYPLSRGQSERTGDSLLIKCFETFPKKQELLAIKVSLKFKKMEHLKSKIIRKKILLIIKMEMLS